MPEKFLPEQNSRTALTLGEQEEPSGRRWPQYIAAGVATLGAFSAGTCMAWTSPALPLLQDKRNHFIVTDTQASWIGSLLNVGAALGALVGGALCERLGRRRSLLLLAGAFLASWLLLAFSASVRELYAGRVLAGAAIGVLSVVAPVYVCEVAEARVRGSLGALFQLQITVGILAGYCVGLTDNARTLALICAAVPVVFGVAVLWLPESPVYLLSRGDREGASKSLRWLRGSARAQVELQRARNAIAAATGSTKKSLREVAAERIFRKALVVVVGLMAVQQLSGINAVIFYLAPIFSEATDALAPSTAAIIAGAIQVISTGTSSILADRAGRRPLLLLSASVMTVSHLALGLSFQLPQSLPSWLPVLSVALFLIAFSLGFGPVPWLMMGEMFAPEGKAIASSTAATANWMLSFAVTKSFSSLQSSLGLPSTFYLYSAVCAIGTIFVGTMVPETKGKELTRIQAELSNQGIEV